MKLNERYLHIYLLSLFVLLAGDAIVGIVWLLRYKNIVASMPSDLLQQIQVQYVNNTSVQVRYLLFLFLSFLFSNLQQIFLVVFVFVSRNCRNYGTIFKSKTNAAAYPGLVIGIFHLGQHHETKIGIHYWNNFCLRVVVIRLSKSLVHRTIFVRFD